MRVVTELSRKRLWPLVYSLRLCYTGLLCCAEFSVRWSPYALFLYRLYSMLVHVYWILRGHRPRSNDFKVRTVAYVYVKACTSSEKRFFFPLIIGYPVDSCLLLRVQYITLSPRSRRRCCLDYAGFVYRPLYRATFISETRGLYL